MTTSGAERLVTLSSHDGPPAATDSRSGTMREVVAWGLSGLFAFPVAVLSHELGHYVLYRVFGFRGSAMHYGSASFVAADAFWRHVRSGDLAGASAIAPTWQVALASAGGLLVTYATIVLCCALARRVPPPPLAIAVGLIAPVRFLSGIPMVLAALTNPRFTAETDEGSVAQLLGVPGWPLAAVGLVSLVATWVWLARRSGVRTRQLAVAALVAGMVGGGFLYATLLGPWLLP